jgi:phosphate-selective porin OprO and OprP
MSKKSLFVTAAVFAALISTGAIAQEAVTTDIDFSKGSPRFTTSDGQFQFRIRGRYMMDAYAQKNNFSGATADTVGSGFATRRARLGVEGKFNSVFTFKAETTFKSGGTIEFNDVWLGYDNNGTEVIVGQNYFTSSLDGLTSSLAHLTNERGMATAAFAQDKRNTGVVVRKYADNWMVVGGLYGDSADTAETAAATESRFGEIRGDYAFSAKRGDYLVVGAHARYRDSNNGSKYSYNARPVQNNYGSSSLLVGPTNVLTDTNIGLEGFFSKGSFSVLADAQTTKADTGATTYDLNGGMVEVSYYLTGETRSYDVKNGELKSIKPNSPMQDGGFGAWALVARYDRLDYSDFVASTGKGSEADAITAGVAWQPTDFVMVRAMYGKTEIKRGNTATREDVSVDTFTLRTQFNF